MQHFARNHSKLARENRADRPKPADCQNDEIGRTLPSHTADHVERRRQRPQRHGPRLRFGWRGQDGTRGHDTYDCDGDCEHRGDTRRNEPTDDLAGQDGHESPRFDHAGCPDDFVARDMLGDDRVFYRSEKMPTPCRGGRGSPTCLASTGRQLPELQ